MIGSTQPPLEEAITDSVQEHIATTTVIDRDIDIRDMTQYIEGSSWSVDYYNSQLAKDDIASPQDIVTDSVIEQYVKYNGLELKVTTPIENVSFTDVEGEAIITDITPTQGDSFVAELSGNIKCIFRVIEVDRNLYNFKPIFTIKYKLNTILTKTTVATFNDLNSKVIREFYYDSKAMFEKKRAIVSKETLRFRRDIDRHLRSLTSTYFDEFMLDRVGSLVLPYDGIVIDPVLEEFIFKTFTYNDISKIRRMSRLGGSDSMMLDTVYNNILYQEPMTEYTKKYICINTSTYSKTDVFLKTLRHYGITGKVTYETTEGDDVVYDFTTDKAIEVMGHVNRHINDRAYDQEGIASLFTEYRRWDKLDKFFLVPILYVLAKQASKYSYDVGV
jgi:uncharacterized protein (UPF0264 family)